MQFPGTDPAAVPRALGHLRVERAGPLHHRRARRLSADQAGDEPGLRGRRVHPRQRGRARRRAAARRRSSRAARPRPCPQALGAHPGAACRCFRASPRCSCASSCSTATCARPRRARSIFRRNDYTNTFYSIVDGERRGRAPRTTTAGAECGCRAGRRRVLRRAGPDLRAPPLGDGQRGRGLRADRDAAALDAEADRLGRVRAARRSTRRS